MISAERKCCVVWKSFYCFFLQFNTSLLGQKLCGICSCKWYKEEIMDSVLTVVSCFNATFCILQNDSSLTLHHLFKLLNFFLIYLYKTILTNLKIIFETVNSTVGLFYTTTHYIIFPNHYLDLRWHLKRDSNGSSFNINYAYNT